MFLNKGKTLKSKDLSSAFGINDAQAGQDQGDDSPSPNIYWDIIDGKLVKIK